MRKYKIIVDIRNVLKKIKYKPKIKGRDIFGKSMSTLKNLGSLWYRSVGKG